VTLAAKKACKDGAKNGEETDVDCGGPSCSIFEILCGEKKVPPPRELPFRPSAHATLPHALPATHALRR
jgi:hypothetical protein